jgi:PAS domain-containing protein
MDTSTALALAVGLVVGVAGSLALAAAVRATRARRSPRPRPVQAPAPDETSDPDSSEQRYRTLYDASPDLYLTLDAEGRITDANRTALEALGLSRDEVVGRPFAEFL